MGILTVRSYDMELLNRLLDEIWRWRWWRWVWVSGNFAKKKMVS